MGTIKTAMNTSRRRQAFSPVLAFLLAAFVFTGLLTGDTAIAKSQQPASERLGAVSFPGSNTGLIPDAIAGCGNPSPQSLDVTFEVSGIPRDVVSVQVQAEISHPWVGDLSATLISPNGDQHLLFANTGGTAAFPCGDGSSLAGAYTFGDTATGTNWWTAAANNVNSIPTGLYRSTAAGPLESQTEAPVTSIDAAFAAVPNANGIWILRVNDANAEDIGSVISAQLTINSVPFPLDAPFDFDGDGASDISVFRPNPSSLVDGSVAAGTVASQWWLLFSGDKSSRGLAFGSDTDIPVPADYTGDGKADVAFYRPDISEWFVLRSEDDSYFAFPFGAPGDVPAPGDYDGDGISDPAVFRPAIGTWFILRSSDSQTSSVPFGVAEDLPTIADFDGDGLDDIAVYRPSVQQWWQLRSAEGPTAFAFGSPEDKAVVGDFTGDGKADLAFYRPSVAQWYVVRSEDSASYFAFPWGAPGPGDLPTPGDFDGDGTWDAAVWRESEATWYVLQSTAGFEAVQFGAAGDRPIPNLRVIP